MTAQDPRRAELITHADALLRVKYAMAISDIGVVAHQHSNRNEWGPYDHVREALIQVLTAILDNDRKRGERMYDVLLDETGEGVEWFLDRE
jgi:hypothetical protein